jgi:hypothetical protein
MGWRGTLRTIVAAERRAARAGVQRQKLAAKRDAALQKLNQINEAAAEVQGAEEYQTSLLSLHTRSAPTIDWKTLAHGPKPNPPPASHSEEIAAREKRAGYSPSWLDKLLRRTQKRIESLDRMILTARDKDAAANEDAISGHEKRLADWASTRQLAARMLDFDTSAWKETFNQRSTLSQEKALGTHFSMKFHDGAVIDVTIQVGEEKLIPTQTKSLLASGKLSAKKTPANEFWDTYRHYVCSAFFRVARELRAIFPLRMLYVTATRELLDESTGHVAVQPILSAKMPPETLDRLEYASIDPVMALSNFVHRVEFRRGKGFRPIEPVPIDDPRLRT